MEESFWKQTYEKILIGMGLFGITLKFLFLNQILPFIGARLLFTGFRKLRLRKPLAESRICRRRARSCDYHCDTLCLEVCSNGRKSMLSYAWKVN